MLIFLETPEKKVNFEAKLTKLTILVDYFLESPENLQYLIKYSKQILFMNIFIKDVKNIIDNKNLNGVLKRFKIGKLINEKYPEGASDKEYKEIASLIKERGYSRVSLRDMLFLYKGYRNKKDLLEQTKNIAFSIHLSILRETTNDEEHEFYLKYREVSKLSDNDLKKKIKEGYYFEYINKIKSPEYKFEIENVSIKNYKALVDVEIKSPNKFLVFVGANASGKTSVFEALDFFNHSYKIEGSNVFSVFGGLENILNYNEQEKENNNLEIKISLKKDFSYSIKYDGKKISKSLLFNDNFKKNFSRIFIDNTKRAKNRLNTSSRLNLDAENLPKMLKDIFSDNDIKDEFLEQVKILIPVLKDIEIETNTFSGKDELLIYEKATKKPFKGSLISEGTYYILSLLALIYQTEEQQFICIEEPEIGLNPYAVKMLIKFFREVAKQEKHHIWITTHSPLLVSLLNENELITVNKDNKTGHTNLKQYKKGDFNGKKADRAWLTNELKGGLPW